MSKQYSVIDINVTVGVGLRCACAEGDCRFLKFHKYDDSYSCILFDKVLNTNSLERCPECERIVKSQYKG